MHIAMQRIDFKPLMTTDEVQQAALDEQDLMIQRRLSLAVSTLSDNTNSTLDGTSVSTDVEALLNNAKAITHE